MRDAAVQILTQELEHAEENDPTVNGSFLADLLDLKAVESLPVIRSALERNLIDESVAGDWEEVLHELGQEADPDDPLLKKPSFQPSWPLAFLEPGYRAPQPQPARPARSPAPPTPKKDGKAKQKQKRKAAEASRKANRAKKKRK